MDRWERDQVESFLREGKSLRLVSEISGVSRSALFRHHKNHPPETRPVAPKRSGPVIYNPRALWEREVAVRQAEWGASLRKLERDVGQRQAARLLSLDPDYRTED
jgi:hypothetical protein